MFVSMATSKGKALTLLNYLSPQRFKHNQSLELILYIFFSFFFFFFLGGGVVIYAFCVPLMCILDKGWSNELDL